MDKTPIQAVMHRAPVAAKPSMSLLEAAMLLHAHGINGLPVVDDEYRVVGVLGIKDIVRVPFRSGTEVFISRATPLSRIVEHLRTLRVRDAMSEYPLCVHPEDSLGTAIHLMINRGIHPVPVVTGDRRLVGIVARADVVGVILASAAALDGLGARPAEEPGTVRIGEGLSHV
jgi:CBS domain-containing protein